MTIDPGLPKIDSIEETWREIEKLVNEIATLSKSDLPPQEFFPKLLDRAVTALAAVGGAIWLIGPGGQLQRQSQIRFDQTGLAENPANEQQHAELLNAVLKTGEAANVSPHAADFSGDSGANPTPFLLVLCPFKIDAQPVGLIEVFQRPETRAAAQHGYLKFLTEIAELAADFSRNLQLRQLKTQELFRQQLADFSHRIHSSLELRKTAYSIANEGRRLIGCDRVSVLINSGTSAARAKCRILAISGVDVFDERANTVRLLEKMSEAMVQAGEVLWYTGEPVTLDSEIEGLMQTYLVESRVRLLAIVPLKALQQEDSDQNSDFLGVLVVEKFLDEIDDGLQQRVTAVCRHSVLALQNAAEHDGIPLLPVLRLLQHARWYRQLRRLTKTKVVVLLLVIACVLMVFVPADFEIEARGTLQPAIRRNIFAPSDGIVEKLSRRDAKGVLAGDVLAVLRNPQLDFEFRRVGGELEVARKKLSAVQAARLKRSSDRRTRPAQDDRLTAEEEELKVELQSLNRQYEILKNKQAELTIRSPIKGHVLTWNLEQKLNARPVRRGQILMSVDYLDGPWILELRVPDHHIGHVLDARKTHGAKLAVSYILGTDPGVHHQSKVETVAMATENDENKQPTVLITAAVDTERVSRLRPGATVVANIYCGRRSIGYVWLHDLIDVIKSRLFF